MLSNVIKDWIIFLFLRAINRQLSIFQLSIKRLRSSMDRISDSGSDDMGSNPVEVTYSFESRVIYKVRRLFLF
jgi:hypothetical protein